MFFNLSLHIKKMFYLLHMAQNAKGVFIYYAVFSLGIVLDIRHNVSIAGIVINLSCDGHREDTKQPRS